ncbi:hypothetical protein CY35_04G008600 [Sphagnum magellanicum]|nr:hypothetical protein CY35_04G008600 [Sphagnum magellanicum]
MKANESKDFLDVMLFHPGVDGVTDKLDELTIKGVAIDMLVAGTDTTATTVEWALVKLIRHPNVLKKVQDELDDAVGPEHIIDENDIPQLKYLQAIVK